MKRKMGITRNMKSAPGGSDPSLRVLPRDHGKSTQAVVGVPIEAPTGQRRQRTTMGHTPTHTHDVYIFGRWFGPTTCYAYLPTTYYLLLISTYNILRPSTYCLLLPPATVGFFLRHASAAAKQCVRHCFIGPLGPRRWGGGVPERCPEIGNVKCNNI